jgi:hypothetical protein
MSLTGTNTHVMTALKINIPDVSAEIAFNLSEILAAAITSDRFDMKTTIASAFLLTSTLSLVIAAAKISERLNAISAETSGILILLMQSLFSYQTNVE